jgi:serine phosphatase RsbU (regulator of sigma subunit)
VLIRYRSARAGSELGGDFYDAIERDDGSLHVVVGDVCGHGADEAALGARLRSAWRALVLAGLDPDTVLGVLEEVLTTERDDDSLFATLCQASFGPVRDAMVLRLAGHPPPFLLGDRSVTVARATTGVLLGPFPGARRPATAVPLDPAWRVLLFTDGLIEGRARPDAPDRLGAEAVAAILSDLVAQGLEGDGLLDGLLTEVELANGEPLADDVALCLVEGHIRA